MQRLRAASTAQVQMLDGERIERESPAVLVPALAIMSCCDPTAPPAGDATSSWHAVLAPTMPGAWSGCWRWRGRGCPIAGGIPRACGGALAGRGALLRYVSGGPMFMVQAGLGQGVAVLNGGAIVLLLASAMSSCWPRCRRLLIPRRAAAIPRRRPGAAGRCLVLPATWV